MFVVHNEVLTSSKIINRFIEVLVPKPPLHFDSRNPIEVLRLRFRDWMWPVAVVLIIAIPFLGRTNGGVYKVGSFTYYMNTYAPLAWLAAFVFVGVRWFWIGRLQPRRPGYCGQCNYPVSGNDAVICPECGADEKVMTATRRISIARILIDLPSVVCILFPIFITVMIALSISGIIDGD